MSSTIGSFFAVHLLRDLLLHLAARDLVRQRVMTMLPSSISYTARARIEPLPVS